MIIKEYLDEIIQWHEYEKMSFDLAWEDEDLKSYLPRDIKIYKSLNNFFRIWENDISSDKVLLIKTIMHWNFYDIETFESFKKIGIRYEILVSGE